MGWSGKHSYLAELFGLSGRVAVVTGGSSGIGAGMASALARAGARVVLVARDEKRLTAAAAVIREGGGEAAWVPADLSERIAVTPSRPPITTRSSQNGDPLRAGPVNPGVSGRREPAGEDSPRLLTRSERYVREGMSALTGPGAPAAARVSFLCTHSAQK